MVARPDSVRWVPSWSLIGEGSVDWCPGRAPPGQIGPCSGVCAELALGEGESGGGAAERGRSGGARSHGRRSEGHAGRRWDRGPWAAAAARRRARFLVMVYFPAYCGSVGPGQPGTPRSGIRAVGVLAGLIGRIGPDPGRDPPCAACRRAWVRRVRAPLSPAPRSRRPGAHGTVVPPCVRGADPEGCRHGDGGGAGRGGHCSWEQLVRVRNVRVSHERLLTGPACPLRHVDWWNRSHWCGLTVERQVSSVNTPVPNSCCRNNSTLQVS